MTLQQYQAQYRLTLSKRTGNWHVLANPLKGQVNALDMTRGKMVAISDKGLCLIITQVNEVVIGHKDWFVKDVEQANESQRNENKKSYSKVKEFDPSFYNDIK